MSVKINLYAKNDFHYTGEAEIHFELFGYKRFLYLSDVPEMLEMLREVCDQLNEEHVTTEYSYEHCQIKLFHVNSEHAYLCETLDVDPAERAQWWLLRAAAQPEGKDRLSINIKEFCNLHAVIDPERGAQLDQEARDSGWTVPSPSMAFTLDDWAQTAVRNEIDRVTADLEEQAKKAAAALQNAVDSANAKVDANMAGVEWTTRKVGDWNYNDGKDVHEFLHTITVDGTTFKVREGDIFDAGSYIKFDDGTKRGDSPEADRAYRLVQQYGERAKGSLGMRTM